MSAIGHWSALGHPTGWFDITTSPSGWFSDVTFSPVIANPVRGVKVFLDGAFTTKPLKMWDGAQWKVVSIKVWTGAAWD